MPTPERQMRRTKWALRIAGLACLISLTFAGVALVDRFNQTDQRRERAAEIQAATQRVLKQDCLEIEKLKGAQREDALQNYRDLDKNGKLLNIKITPALRKAAKEARDDTLRKYAAEPCPRPEIKV